MASSPKKEVTHIKAIPRGLRVGDSINIEGQIVGRRFTVLLCEEVPPQEGKDIFVSFAFNPNGSWTLGTLDCTEDHRIRERRGVTTVENLAVGGDFKLRVHVTAKRVNVELNDKTITWLPLTFPVEAVKHVVIRGEDKFISLEFDDVWSMASKSRSKFSVSSLQLPPDSDTAPCFPFNLVTWIPDSQDARNVSFLNNNTPVLSLRGQPLPTATRGRVLRRDESNVKLTHSRARLEPGRERIISNCNTAPSSPNPHRRRTPLPQMELGGPASPLVRTRSNSERHGESIDESINTNRFSWKQSLFAEKSSTLPRSTVAAGNSPTIPRKTPSHTMNFPSNPKPGMQLVAVESPRWKSEAELADNGTDGMYVRRTSESVTGQQRF